MKACPIVRLLPMFVLFGCGAAPELDPAGQTEGEVNAVFGSTGQYFRFRSVRSSKCIDVTGASTADNAALIQYTCASANAGPNQQLYFRRLDGNYQLSAKHSAKCLRVSGASSSIGAAVVQAPCARSGSGLTGSQYTFTLVNNAYRIRNQNSGLCLQVRGNSTANNAVIEQATCSSANNQLFTVEAVAPPAVDPPITGQWDAPITLPSIPVAAALLPTGKVLTWASWNRNSFGGNSPTQTYTVLFDPVTSTSQEVLVTQTSHDMFCPGTAMLPDGRVFVNGGGNTVDETSIYNSMTAQWTADDTMAQARWYNVSVTLPDGRVFTLGGNRTSGLDGRGEIWSAQSGWSTLSGAVMTPLLTSDPANRSQEHPRLFVAPDGRIFVPGPTPNMQFYNLSGSGSVQSAGTRGDDEFSQNDVTVMFDTGRLLKAGGNPNYDVGTAAPNTPSSHNSYVIDINSGVTVTKVASMRYPRAFHNGVVLPNGEVLVVGGLDNGDAFTDQGAVMVPEMFNATRAAWTELAAMARPRTYHSVALLLPDATVLVGGGGLCGSCSANHADIEIYHPPYLFQGTRPQITSSPASTGYGRTFNVSTTGTVSGFSLIRISSVTHTVNTDQRLLRPGFSGGGPYTLTAPASANLAPPGYYLLFALNGSVPSVGKFIQIH